MGRSAFWNCCLLWGVPLSPTEQAAIKKFGAAVRRQRTAQAMTQERLAELCEVHLRTIQKIEAGDINILLTTIKRIQKALKCEWSELMN